VGWNGGSQHVAGWNMIVGQQNQPTAKRKEKWSFEYILCKWAFFMHPRLTRI
jgi:hypothetical protein